MTRKTKQNTKTRKARTTKKRGGTNSPRTPYSSPIKTYNTRSKSKSRPRQVHKTVKFRPILEDTRLLTPPETPIVRDEIFQLPKCSKQKEKVYPCRIHNARIENEQEHRELLSALREYSSTPEQKREHYAYVFNKLKKYNLLETPMKRKRSIQTK
jgi:hypothetical protein